MGFEKLKNKFLHRHGDEQQTPLTDENANDRGNDGPGQSAGPGFGEDTSGGGNSGPHAEVVPRVKGEPKLLGLVSDPALNRDSGGSSRFGNKIFWTYRDTQLCDYSGNIQALPVLTSTASWTDFNQNGMPALQNLPPGADPLRTPVLRQYGNNNTDHAFFPILDRGCDARAGMRDDGTRHAIWPDQPPLVTQTTGDGIVTAYTWIRKAHIKGLEAVVKNPATTLFRLEYDPSQDGNLPRVHVVHEHFWGENEISFGVYGNLVHDGIAYLYGQAGSNIALAKVAAHAVEDKSKYEYWVNNSWTRHQPSMKDSGINIPDASAGSQGTYYYSEPWQCFVWIGGCQYPCADFFITTAPTPTGPWIKPFKFYSGVNGDHALPAYSLQAHPAMRTSPQDNSMFLTYTKCDVGANDVTVYTTPLVYVEWE